MGSDLDYSGAVENGHGSYEIVPRQKKFLVFPKKGGGLVFAKSVTVPAREGVHFLRDALNTVMGRG